MLATKYDNCTGCGACVQSCPKKCIYFDESELGIIVPKVDQTKCIKCNQCNLVCPVNSEIEKNNESKFYAVVNKNKNIVNRSTSGGFFTVLAEYILDKDGVVYGCAFTENFKAKHIKIDNKEDLEKLRGSKYLQSDTSTTFIEVKKDLQKNKYVLYSGTPCQIDGLMHYLKNKDYDNLITADLVCHGVGSQAFFDTYKDFIEKKYGKIKEFHFRRKEFAGWSCGGVFIYESTEHQKLIKKPLYDYNNYYYHYFLKGDIYRESCYKCKYASTKRVGDFTMGDFWGVEKYNLSLDTFDGCSLVIVNSGKAFNIFKSLKSKLDLVEVCKDQAIKDNAQLNKPSKVSDLRKDLVKLYGESTDGYEIDKFFRKKNRQQIIKLKLKSLIPYRFKYIIRKLRK